jgi:hypothetical protein
LNLFHFFNYLLVSFGNVWKYLTLTGTIWAQSNSGKKGGIKELPFFLLYDDLKIMAFSMFPFFSSALILRF